MQTAQNQQTTLDSRPLPRIQIRRNLERAQHEEDPAECGSRTRQDLPACGDITGLPQENTPYVFCYCYPITLLEHIGAEGKDLKGFERISANWGIRKDIYFRAQMSAC